MRYAGEDHHEGSQEGLSAALPLSRNKTMNKNIARLRRAKTHPLAHPRPRRAAPVGAAHRPAHLRPGVHRRRLQGAGFGLHHAGRRQGRPEERQERRRRRQVGKRSPSAPRPRASRRSRSTARATATTAASRRWPKPPAKVACSSDGLNAWGSAPRLMSTPSPADAGCIGRDVGFPASRITRTTSQL